MHLEDVVTLLTKSDRLHVAVRCILHGNDWSAIRVTGIHTVEPTMVWLTQESSGFSGSAVNTKGTSVPQPPLGAHAPSGGRREHYSPLRADAPRTLDTPPQPL